VGFLKKIVSALFESGEGQGAGDVHWEYVRCRRCGEKIPVRVDLRDELTPQYDETSEAAYYTRKVVLGSGDNRCFQQIEVELFFDANRRLVSRYVTGGDFITRDEFYAEEEPNEGQ